MKMKFLVPFILLVAASCNSPEEKRSDVKIENVKLDVDIDPVCKMPVKNNIKDTAFYEGKLYGFCAKGCKEEFLNKGKEAIEKGSCH